MTNIKYTVENTRTGRDIYRGTFEATTKPTNDELIDAMDRNNFGGYVNYCIATDKPNEYRFDVEVYRD